MRYGDDHRPILCRLVDDPDFQALSGDAQRVWFFLRVSPECGPVGLFRFYASLHRERLKMTEDTFEAALEELVEQRWVLLERGYILLRNAMRFEPGFSPAKDSKHLAHVHRVLAGLGHLSIARQLLAWEGLPTPQDWPSMGLQSPKGDPNEAPASPSRGPSKALACPAPAPAPLPAPTPVPERETAPPGGGASSRSSKKGPQGPKEPEQDPDGFAQFWERLPTEMRKNRGKARDVWAKLTAVQRAKALQRIRPWLEDWLRKRKRDGWAPEPPYAATWLEGERWEDALEPHPDEVCRCGSRKLRRMPMCRSCAEGFGVTGAELDRYGQRPIDPTPEYPPEDPMQTDNAVEPNAEVPHASTG